MIGKEGKLNFKYLGLNLISKNGNITLDQFQYIQNLQKINIPVDGKSNPTIELSKEEKDILRAKIGQLLWISNQTRPDISFDVSTLASNLNASTVNELIYCNKIK